MSSYTVTGYATVPVTCTVEAEDASKAIIAATTISGDAWLVDGIDIVIEPIITGAYPAA